MCRSVAGLPALLALLVAGCHVTIVTTPTPTAGEAADSTVVAGTPDTVTVRPAVPPRPIRGSVPRAQPAAPLPTIAIESPAQWGRGEPDTAAVGARQQLRVVGHVHHPDRISAVRINGEPASMVGVSRDGVTRFTAYVPPAEPGLMEVRIEADADAGTGVATYYLNVTGRVATLPRPTPPPPLPPGEMDTGEPPTGAPETPPPGPPAGPPSEPPAGPPAQPPAGPPTVPPAVPPGEPPVGQPAPPPAPVTAADSAWAERARWAVVIGVGEYADPGIAARATAVADARAFLRFLASPAAGGGGIPGANVVFLTGRDATTANIRGAMTTFLRQVAPGDVVLVYLATTAVPDPRRPTGAYLLTYDAQATDPAATALSVDWLTDALRGVGAHQKIVLADVLQAAGQADRPGRGGGRDGGGPAHNLVHRALESSGPRDRSLVVLTATSDGAAAQGGDRWEGHGAFAHSLLRGLAGEADGNGDRVVTLAELVQYTRDAVRRGTDGAQRPGLSAASYDRQWPMARVVSR